MSSNTAQARPHRLASSLLALVSLVTSVLFGLHPAAASTVSSAAFSGGAGTVSVGETLYAKNGGALTLTVTTSSDTKCVEVRGAFTARETSNTAKSSWTFTFTAGTGNGVQTATAKASPNFNDNNCTGQSQQSQSASFILDNTGPVVTALASPAANAAGWNNSNVAITWSASDAGSGVASGPTPATDSQIATTGGLTKTSTATDRLGNTGSGSVTVKLDKNLPTITGNRSPAANPDGWNNTDVTISFTCSDSTSGIKSCSGPTTLATSAANQSVTGTAVDNADNSASAAVSGINIDKVAPTLSGAPTTSSNGAGWYNDDVTTHWTAADALSGLAAPAPADSTISSEGTGLTASASISDKAGNTASATSSPAVKIDKTAPNTTATAPANWNNSAVTVSLSPADALSGAAVTYYALDGGAPQSGTSVTISAEGIHTLQFWSIDNAGNTEAAKTVQVKIDKTPPTINHTQSPAANANGWNNTDVTVSFVCGDTLAGVVSCTSPQTVTTEGQNQVVTGTAIDNAGNSTTDPASVSIDKTPPTISAAVGRPANENGWYTDDVTVSFTCGDALSGVASCTGPQTLGEGANQSASGTVSDAAENTASAAPSGINVDKTAPSLSGAATTGPNANGWYDGDVIIHWTCNDALSGTDGPCPADSIITGEGDNLSASASVSDLAGNSTSVTVSGIKIDRTTPSTLASVPAPLASGWYAGSVLVTLTTGADLSGVDKTYYSVDGGEVQEYATPFNHSLKGVHTITFWSVDRAGNIEDANAPGHSFTLKIDGAPPIITGSRTPAANGFGWNNGDVTVSFSCSDAESGIAGCSDPVTLSNAGAGQSVIGQTLDNAGNSASATVGDINIDLTNPILTGAASTNPNAFGWYKGDVTIQWTSDDGLSGIDPATQPADSVITGEGSNLGAGPVAISDKAGNVGSASVSGIKIDRTAPTIGGHTVYDDGTPRSANGAGWFNSAVRVRFSCGDALSDMQECGSDVVLSSDGANQSATGSATDRADNAASATVSGINIDSQAPRTDADLQCTSKNGWCRGNKATVVLTAADQGGLSGVKEIRYSTNGSTWQSTAGASASVSINLAGSGKARVLFYAVDQAGNSETENGVEVKYDTIAPTVTHTLSPAANSAGWNNADVTVHFDASDDTDGSGVDPITVTVDQTIASETAGTVVNGSADDRAGNTGTDSVTVKLDKTAPTISGAPTTSPTGSNGWYTGPVTVDFTCDDQGSVQSDDQGSVQSGIATCPANVVLSTDGSNQSASGTAIDAAGNAASAAVTSINVDATKPTIESIAVTNGARYTIGDPATPAGTPACTASDSGSGPASCVVAVTGGRPNGVGTFNFTATARDNAGNTTTETGSYTVIYRWDGFLQPINDTAHQIAQGVSIFKGGSTVPVKFQLKKADGTVIPTNMMPQWLNPAKGSPTTASVDESLYSVQATSGNTYRWDSAAQQYIYNWSTKGTATGFYHRIGVTLDDGETYFVYVGLR